MKYDIFISYSRKDIEFAREVCAVLDSYKQYYTFEYFFDQSEITSRDEYLKRISSAILESRVVLFLASKNSYDSEFCAKELLFADKRGRHIHQYCIDDAEMPSDIEMLLGTHQYRELKSTPIENEVREVLADVLECKVLFLAELGDNSNADCKSDKQGAKLTFTPTKPFVQTQVTLRTYKVGDYYDEGNKNRGVVFEVSEDGRHGKIVSLNEEYLKWCTEEQFDKYILVGANSDTDGKINTDIVKQRSDFEEYSPFKWCRNQGKKWYLPSQEELRAIFSVLNLVNKTLLSKQSVEIKREWYWSSTEEDESRAWSVNMDIGIGNGLACSDEKGEYQYVRAVATF